MKDLDADTELLRCVCPLLRFAASHTDNPRDKLEDQEMQASERYLDQRCNPHIRDSTGLTVYGVSFRVTRTHSSATVLCMHQHVT